MGDKYDAKDTMVTSSFNDRESAERAYESIVQRGYDKDDVAVLMTEDTHKKYFPKGDKSEMGERGDHALKGAAIGGGVGGAVGATALGIAAATAAIAIPGIGLMVAGPLAGALTGGAIGATSGGIIGLLIGAGIPADRAKVYEKDLKDGAIVLGVKPRNPDDAQYFEREWQDYHHHA